MIDWTQIKTAEQREAERLQELANSARSKRNRLLTKCDWTQMTDSPVDSSKWIAYRQALRDVPQQAGFPEVITWPVSPDNEEGDVNVG